MLPLAPALFSPTKGCLNWFCSTSATERAIRSEGPPAGKLLTNFTARVGHAGACASEGKAASASSAATQPRRKNGEGCMSVQGDAGRLDRLFPAREVGFLCC